MTRDTHRPFTRRTALKGSMIIASALAVGTQVACSPKDAGVNASGSTTASSGGDVFPTSDIQSLVDDVVHRTVKEIPTKRLAEGLLPPTNQWFSGLVFGDQAQPVFPLPLSFGLTETGFAFGLPTISATEKNIAGGYKPDVTIDTGSASAQVSAYDTATVTVAGLDSAGDVLGHVTIAQGSPFVSYTSEDAQTLTSPLTFAQSGEAFTAEAGDVAYGLVVSDGEVSGADIILEKGGTATWFVVPADGSLEALAGLAKDPVTGSGLEFSVSKDTVQTTITYVTRGKTAVATLPHQEKNLANGITADLGSYPSIYGTMKLCSGNELSWSAPLSAPTSRLELDELSKDERTELSEQVTQDIASLPDFPADTYFGGKALYRAAMLLQLAQQLELADPAASLRTTLVTELTKWTDPKGADQREAFCFVYDDKAKGLVGLTPSFGSDEFNDHHFHYGYFLYTAGIVAQDDPELAAKLAPVMDLLAADIASSGSNGLFPDRRTFDAYASHSWASGTSPFADGNNQESSSEAITAWTGLDLWAKASGNAALETEATWMLSSEAQAGLAYWTNFDVSEPVYTGYGHKIVSLNWGGKRDYATWFSPEPAAMLGILVIPMSPASTYLGGDPARITANVAEATSGKFDQKFGDYLLMYSALAGATERKTALDSARTLDAQWIDDGNSRSYMLAWLMSTSD